MLNSYPQTNNILHRLINRLPMPEHTKSLRENLSLKGSILRLMDKAIKRTKPNPIGMASILHPMDRATVLTKANRIKETITLLSRQRTIGPRVPRLIKGNP